MIDRQGTKVFVECDACDEVFESEEHEEFGPMWLRAKRDGWRAKKIGSEWVHECPNCH